MANKKTGGRSPSVSGGMHPRPEVLYYHVARDALETAESETAQDDKSTFRRNKACVTAIVFSALCLEAFINQEYEKHTETKEISEDVERLPLETKWLLLPRLLGAGRTFDIGGPPFQTFKELIKVRNHRLVHFKPRGETHRTPREGSRKEPFWGDFAGKTEYAKKYVKCVEDMVNELNKITSDKTRGFKATFDSAGFVEVWRNFTIPYEFL